MASKASNEEKFDASDFVEHLLEEGGKSSCDETVESFRENRNLPPFYDETLYKRGQKFFYDNIFVMLYSKFLGLLSVLAIPSIVRILMHTNMSGTPMTSYKRYLATVFYMVFWYQSDFSPDSKLWQSLMEVKKKHNSASKRSCRAGLARISQKDMALTQFGFMGFALAKREKIGLHNVKDEDLRALVHIWRVVGYILGIEDRFNICRDSVEETTAICRELADQVFRPAIEKKDQDFIKMGTYMAEGMWAMNPTLDAKVYITILHKLLRSPDNNCKRNEPIKLSFYQRMILRGLLFTIWSYQFTIVRVYHNYTQYVSLWLMKVFPFLAYYKFGYSNSHVTILQDKMNKN